MIKFLIILMVVVVAAVSGALILLEDPGYALFSYAGVTVETTLSMLFVLAVIGFVGIVVGIRLVKLTVFLPDNMYAWGQRRREQRVQQYFYTGLRALAEGRWKKAEKLLITSVKHSELPLLNYLAAARAAQHMGSHEKRDQYLQLAMKSDKQADLATELTQAELQLVQGQREQALASLNSLVEKDPHNAFVKEMLLTVYQELGEWKSLKEKLPEFRKLEIISSNDADQLEQEILLHLIQDNFLLKDVASLQASWDALTKKQKSNVVLIQEYAKQFISLDQDDKAERLLSDAIKKQWNKNLVYLYGQVKSSLPDQQLKLAEGWTKSHDRDAIVNLSLGRICMRNKLWGKARIYLERSIELGARAETYFELGVLLEHLNDKDASLLCYRNGLKLTVNDIDIQEPDFSDVGDWR